MDSARGSLGSRPPLSAYLLAQLRAHGYADANAAERAHELTQTVDADKRSSLLVDLGTCKFLEGDRRSAVALWCRAIPAAPTETRSLALLNTGLTHEDDRSYRQAADVLMSVIDLGVADHEREASLALARSQRRLGDHGGAMETLAALSETMIVDGSYDRRLGEALLDLGDIAAEVEHDDRAERAWRAAIAKGDLTTRRAAMGRLGISQAPVDATKAPITDEHALVPAESRDLHTLELAQTHIKLGDRQAAIDLLCGVAGAMLQSADRFHFVDLLVSQGLVNAAIDELEVLLGSEEPTVHHRSAFALGGIYRSHQMLPEAEAMYRRIVTSSDTLWSTKAAVCLADVLQEIGDDAAAVAWCELALTSPQADVRAQAQQRLEALQPPVRRDPQANIAPDEAAAEVEPLPVAVGETAVMAVEVDGRQVIEATIPAPAVPAPTAALAEVDSQPIIQLPDEPSDPVIVVLTTAPDPEPERAPERELVAAATGPKVVSLTKSSVPSAKPRRKRASKAPRAPKPSKASKPFTRMALSRPNPYAVLAPADVDLEVDIAVPQNPYAELAPNFGGESPAPTAQVREPAHWSEMLQEWSDDDRRGFFERFV